jgi:hypothetical protein
LKSPLRGRGNGGLPNRRLADTGFAFDHDRTRGRVRLEKLGDRGQLALSANEIGGLRGHGTSSILRPLDASVKSRESRLGNFVS